MSSTAFRLSPWRQRIDKAIKKSRSSYGGNFCQLATVQSDEATGSLRARNRTIVFRGWQKDPSVALGPSAEDPSNEMLVFCTDARSSKVVNESRTGAELCWWFPNSREQFRVSGTLVYVGKNGEEVAVGGGSAATSNRVLDEMRNRQWAKMSPKAQQQFYWPTPGDSIPEDAPDVEPENQPLAKEPAREAADQSETGGAGNTQEAVKQESPVAQPPPDTYLLLLLRPLTVRWLSLKTDHAQMDTLGFDEASVKDLPVLGGAASAAQARWTMSRMNP